MRICIHRGTKEIGGTGVELEPQGKPHSRNGNGSFAIYSFPASRRGADFKAETLSPNCSFC